MKTPLQWFATQPLHYFRHFQAVVTFMFSTCLGLSGKHCGGLGGGEQHMGALREK